MDTDITHGHIHIRPIH